MHKIFTITNLIFIASIYFLIASCDDKTTDINQQHNPVFEVIEHGCLHMTDDGDVINADSTMPGPHMDGEDYEHTKLKVALVSTADGKLGYIHFGPDITGDIVLMISEDIPLSVTNRTTSGDTQTEIEQTLTSLEIEEDAGCSLLKKAIVFEAKKGGNIVQIGPASFDTVSVIIEEAGHEH